jgi:hypothetical protein
VCCCISKVLLQSKTFFDMLLSDPDYKRRKLELDRLLTADVVRSLFSRAGERECKVTGATVPLASRAFSLAYQSTHGIVRAIHNTEKTRAISWGWSVCPWMKWPRRGAAGCSENFRRHANDEEMLVRHVARASQRFVSDFAVAHALTVLRHSTPQHLKTL